MPLTQLHHCLVLQSCPWIGCLCVYCVHMCIYSVHTVCVYSTYLCVNVPVCIHVYVCTYNTYIPVCQRVCVRTCTCTLCMCMHVCVCASLSQLSGMGVIRTYVHVKATTVGKTVVVIFSTYQVCVHKYVQVSYI